jgi:23S rRNA A2030 N6-methylase RlmJ
MSIKNVKVRFNLSKENARKAYEYLQGICGFMDLSEKAASEDIFLERVISTIREEAAKTNPLSGLLQFVQTPPAQTPTEKENNAETEETMLDFLDSF